VRVTSTRRTARRWQRFLPAALVFFGGAAIAAPLRAQLTVSPAELTLVPGSTPVASFTVGNEARTTVQAILYLNDWDRDDNGENRFFPTGTVVGSCGDRVKIFPQTVRVEPGARQSIRVSAEPVAYPSPCWTIVFVESAPRPAPGGSRIVYVTRLGVKVYVNPPGLARDAEVLGFALEKQLQTSSGPAVDTTQDELALRIRNIGGVPVRLEGRVEFRDFGNNVVQMVRVEEIPALPGSTRRIPVKLPTLPPGKYVALVLISYGGEDDLAAQLELEIH
jgi:P pilus assembly chaperone PapD